MRYLYREVRLQVLNAHSSTAMRVTLYKWKLSICGTSEQDLSVLSSADRTF